MAASLGLSSAQIERLRRVPRDEILEEVIDDDGHGHLHLIRPFEEVLSTYGVTGPDAVRVLAMTGLVGAGQG
jgi:hypothetical protein